MTSPSLRLTREDLRVIYTPGRGVTVYRRIALMGPPRWTRVAWFLSPEAAEGYLGWADWLTILADFRLAPRASARRFIDVDTPSGPLRITRDALTAAVRRLALDESCSTTVNVAGRYPLGLRGWVRLDESDINQLLSSMRAVAS